MIPSPERIVALAEDGRYVLVAAEGDMIDEETAKKHGIKYDEKAAAAAAAPEAEEVSSVDLSQLRVFELDHLGEDVEGYPVDARKDEKVAFLTDAGVQPDAD